MFGGPLWLIFFSSNAAVVGIVNKQTVKHKGIMVLLRDLVLHCFDKIKNPFYSDHALTNSSIFHEDFRACSTLNSDLAHSTEPTRTEGHASWSCLPTADTCLLTTDQFTAGVDGSERLHTTIDVECWTHLSKSANQGQYRPQSLRYPYSAEQATDKNWNHKILVPVSLRLREVVYPFDQEKLPRNFCIARTMVHTRSKAVFTWLFIHASCKGWFSVVTESESWVVRALMT